MLEKERQLGPKIQQETERARDAQCQLEKSLPDLTFLSEEALEGLPHANLLKRGQQLLEKLDATLRRKLAENTRSC